MSILKPVPIVPVVVKNLCPICGRASYSRDGIHPQCAIEQADAKRNAAIQAARKAKQLLADSDSELNRGKPRQHSFSKKCPKCGVQLHVRVLACTCGHKFDRRPK